jgi:NitT/TauT family transport system substrate-binding protein
MGKGMTPDVMFRFLAKENGLDPDKDIITDYSFPTHIELANAIAAGVSELGVISEPLVSMVMQKNPRVRSIINFNDEWIKIFGDAVPFAQTALLVHKDLAEESPALVGKYLRELETSINFVNANIPEASVLIEKYGILPDRELARRSIPLCNLRFTEAWKEKEGIEEYLKVFFNFNPLSIGGKLPDESFYYKIPAY